MSTQKNPSPFKLVENSYKATSRNLEYTPALMARATTVAAQIMTAVSNNLEQYGVEADQVFSASDATALVKFMSKFISTETIKGDAETILDGCPADQLDKMLKSRQSDRCKTFAKGLKDGEGQYITSKLVTYMAAMYAEMLIRQTAKKPYNGSNSAIDLDEGDMNAVDRRIKSLQSKKSRLNALIKGGATDPHIKVEIDETETEIARLNTLKPETAGHTKTVTRSELVETILAMSDEQIAEIAKTNPVAADKMRDIRESLNK